MPQNCGLYRDELIAHQKRADGTTVLQYTDDCPVCARKGFGAILVVDHLQQQGKYHIFITQQVLFFSCCAVFPFSSS